MDHKLNDQNKALYEQLRERILEIIKERKLQPHSPVPSEGELAQLFGVSKMTSKLALQALEKEGIVYRLARRGTFLADRGQPPVGQQLQKSNVQLIALVVPQIDDYIGRIIAAIEQEASRHQFEMMIKTSLDLEQEAVNLSRVKEMEQVSGIILFPHGSSKCSDEILRIKLEGFPLVIIDRAIQELDIDCVCHDHYQGAYDGVEYLLSHGHKQIGFVSPPIQNVSSRQERYQGYIQALITHGIQVNIDQIFLECDETNEFNPMNRQPLLEQFLRHNPQLSAVICVDDYIAARMIYSAQSLEIKVPEQLSVLGFADHHIARYLPVPLTTVRQPTLELGRTAFQLMKQRIEGAANEPQTIKIPTAIVERGSVQTRK